MQPARNLVGAGVELAAGMQRGEDDLRRGDALLVVDVDGHAPAVVADGDRFAGVEHHVDLVAVASQRLVDRIVDQLLHHVVEAGPVVGVAYVHARALADRVETAQHLDVPRVVGLVVLSLL